MKFTLERVTKPDIEPVTLAEAKLHVRQFAGLASDDTLLTALLTGAREWAEDYTGRSLIDQTWRLNIEGGYGGSLGGDVVSGFQGFPGFGAGGPGNRYEWFGWMRRGEIQLHRSPVLALLTFQQINDAGVATDILASTYQLREAASKWPRIVPLNGAVWPTGSIGGGLRLTFRAGYADRLGSPQQGAEMVPERFKAAMKLWLEANYDRDPVMMSKLLDTAMLLVKSERVEMQIA